jgi:hypothetical protein
MAATATCAASGTAEAVERIEADSAVRHQLCEFRVRLCSHVSPAPRQHAYASHYDGVGDALRLLAPP